MDEPYLDMDWAIGEGEACAWCGIEHEFVQPGKTQPRCNCAEDRETIRSLRARIEELEKGWEPVDTEPKDGAVVLFFSPLGGIFLAPSVALEVELTQQQKLAIYKKTGEFPNVGYTATHWRPRPPPPQGLEASVDEKRPPTMTISGRGEG